VGFVFQFYNLIPSLTARENVSVVTKSQRTQCGLRTPLPSWVSASGSTTSPRRLSAASKHAWRSRGHFEKPGGAALRRAHGALIATGVVVLEALERVNRNSAPHGHHTHNADIAGMADRVVHLSNGLIANIETNAARKPPRGTALVKQVSGDRSQNPGKEHTPIPAIFLTPVFCSWFPWIHDECSRQKAPPRPLAHERPGLRIILVIVSGVSTFVMFLSVMDSLNLTRDRFYDEHTSPTSSRS